MSIVRLGKIHLHWCDNCNVPLVEEGRCGICSQKGRKVKITPPGDVRPAFDEDIDLIRSTIDRQWGEGYSKEIINTDKVILLNSSPALDRMDEVIVDGVVVGNLRYNILKKAKSREPYEFIIRPWKDLKRPRKGFIIVDDGAVEPIKNGASALAPGVVKAYTDIEVNDEVIILDSKNNVIASGSAQMSGRKMLNEDYGKGVKNRWRSSDYKPKKSGQTWEDVLEANEDLMKTRIDQSLKFIKNKVDEFDLPVAVAYSGGKDSLATLHLVLDSKIKPDLMFVDTGIELPETIENVKDVAEKHDLNLLMRKAHSGYWNNVDYFGPSARDYRWCCKTCKLGPTSRLIEENYEDGVLSFIGQRRYESQQRMQKGDTWDNPWVPGQKSASPIQDWTALHIWLYIFMKDANYNSLYEKGFKRIGCWLCPASDLAELEMIKENLDEFNELDKALDRYMKKTELPKEWKRLHLWRWIDIPEDVDRIMEELDVHLKESEHGHEKIVKEELLRDERTNNLIKILDKNKNLDNIDKDDIFQIYLKANYCVECGICLVRCPNDALSFDEGIILDEEKCDSCKKCLGKCPVTEYDERVIF